MLIFFSYKANAQSQFYLSEVWDGLGGEMAMFYRNASTTDDLRNVYVAGSTIDTNNLHDIIIQKFSSTGTLIWQQTYNGNANGDDLAADVFVDDDYNVYVTGAAVQNTNNSYDLVVLKYDSSGLLLWTYSYNFGGSPIPYDAGTSIISDNNGSVYVCGTSAGSTTMTDYVTIKLNASNGNQVWATRYDYTQMNEVPTKIAISSTSIIVTGGSQISLAPNRWELATLRYNASTGSQTNETRSNSNVTNGIDEANDLTIDSDGNIYVLGAALNQTTGYNISLFKLDSDLELQWEQHFDGHGAEDKGFGVKADTNGNVYAVGYVTHPTQGKNYSILKYNSSGTLQWSREFNGLANQDDEAVQLVVRGDRIFVTGAARNGAYSDIVTMGYTADGEIFSVKSFESQFGLNDKPTAMGIDLDDNLIVVGQMQDTTGNFRNVTFKYGIYEKPIVPVYIDSVPAYNAGELIVRFDKTAMNLDAVDKKNFDAGLLRDFVHGYVIDSLNAKFPFDAGRLQTFKIFHRMTTADSLSITRLGDTIPVPAFWATLSVIFPEEFDLFEAIDSLNTMKPMVHYGEVNGFGFLASGSPNDYNYNNQSGLYDASHGINVEYAWHFTTGKDYVKVGVYDCGIHWRNWDFSKTGDLITDFSDCKIAGGYDYNFSGELGLYGTTMDYSSPPYYPFPQSGILSHHGTAVAGIIGGIRNNIYCGAGIAGGDFSEAIDADPLDPNTINYGCALYSLRLSFSGSPEGQWITIEKAIEAIFDGSFLSPSSSSGFGLHLQNHSWGVEHFSFAFEEQVLFAYRNSSQLVVSSGNFGDDNCQTQSCVLYPASFDNNWVMKVGANNAAGLVPTFSAHGTDLDFVAPGTSDIIHLLGVYSTDECGVFAQGTSYAAPHVSGTAALMLSQHNLLNDEDEYPNNLAPDDVETILKLTARDIDAPGYPTGPDDKSGYGIIDAGQAVLQVSLPYYYVQHNGTLDNHDFELDVADINISVGNSMCSSDLSPGNYVADRYVVHQNFTNLLPIEYTVVNHWGRPRSTDGFNNNSTVSCRPWVDYSYNETEFSTERLIEIETTTYCWHITEDGNGNPMDVWIPMHPSDARTAYSLHIQTDETVPVDLSIPNAAAQLDLKLYPNPTNSHELFLNGLPNNSVAEVSFVNLTGQITLQTSTSSAENSKIDINDLDAGFYIVQIKVNNALIIRNFIKL